MGLCNNRIVVKVGTSTLTNDAGKSDLRAIDRLVCTLADIRDMRSSLYRRERSQSAVTS
mgnify:CR=1 FL=1